MNISRLSSMLPLAEASLARIGLLHSLKTYIDHQLADLTSRHNSLVSINKLPEELAASILLHATPRGDSDIRALQCLASVQTHWRDIVTSHAAFWTDIHSKSPIDLVELKLRRSQDAPLTINCNTSFMDEDAVEEFVDAIGHHRHRWKSFTFAGRHFHLVEDYLQDPFPILEYLCLEPDVDFHKIDEDDHSAPTEVDISGGPKLRTLSITNTDITFAQLSNLTSLTITEVPDYILLPSSLYDLLSASPYLQELDLSDIYCDENVRPDVQARSMLNDLVLRNFRVQGRSDALTTFLLQVIPVTPNVIISLLSRNTDFFPLAIGHVIDELVQSVGGHRSIIHTLLARPSEGLVRIQLGGCPRLLISRDWLEDVWISIQDAPWIPLLDRLQALNLDTIPVDLRYEATWYETLDQAIDFRTFKPWPNVVKFTLGCDHTQALQIMQWLSRPCEMANGTQTWIWENLSTIYLSLDFMDDTRSGLWPAVRQALHALFEARKANPETAVRYIVVYSRSTWALRYTL